MDEQNYIFISFLTAGQWVKSADATEPLFLIMPLMMIPFINDGLGVGIRRLIK